MTGCLEQCATLARVFAVGLLLLIGRGACAQAPGDPPPRLWGGIGFGYGYLRSGSGPAASAGGVWLEAQVGVRVANQWLVGLELGGIGLEISSRNYDTDASNPSVYGQGITNEFLIIQYVPQNDRGWYGALGAGGLMYDNRALQRVTFNQRSGEGAAALARLGYEWPAARRVHVGVDLNCEYGDVRLGAPLTGRFGVSMLALDFHVAYH